jgi:ribosomal protein S18 acetylase RimI-like enzyme
MLPAVNACSLVLARIADAPRLAAMSSALVEYGLTPSWSASRIGWHIRHPDSLVLAAKAGNVIAGFAIMRYAAEAAHLNLLAVNPAYRRRGIGRQLIVWLEDTALTAGTFIIGLELRATNHAAHAFYSALGYCEQNRVEGYYQGVEAAIRMTRDVRTARPGLTPRPTGPS